MHLRSLGGLRPHQRPIQKLAAFSGFVPTNASANALVLTSLTNFRVGNPEVIARSYLAE